MGVNEKQIRLLPQDIIAITRTENVNKLIEIYSSAFVYFNPTYEDNFPTTNLEALACGIPVITYNTGGSPETIINGYGLVVDKNDSFNWLNNIKIFDKKINVSNNLFDKNKMIVAYLNLYAKLGEN